MGKIKCSLCLKKKQAKKLIFAPKIALRVELSDPAQNHQFRADFFNARLQCSQLLRNCGNINPLYKRGRGERRLDAAQTIGLSCGVTHIPGKIEYNCRYFLVTFRKRIRRNKFSKNGFHNLQGTMSHRPLTNASSLKITAAYWPGFQQLRPQNKYPVKHNVFFSMYCIQHCFICRPLDSAVSEAAGIESRTVATSPLAVRRSNHSARSHLHSARPHPLEATSHPLHILSFKPNAQQTQKIFGLEMDGRSPQAYFSISNLLYGVWKENIPGIEVAQAALFMSLN